MPTNLTRILQAADHEWRYWGKSTWDVPAKSANIVHKDDDEEFAQYIIDNYNSVGGGKPTIADIQDDRYYWSAVGMSAIMKLAGFSKTEFPFAESHSRFIRHFVAARKGKLKTTAFWAYRLNEKGGEPEPGDIVAYARGKKMTSDRANALFDATTSYESHTDVVVAKANGRIEVVGCNVRDSVTKKSLLIGSNGHIEDDQHFWFAVLKLRIP